MFKDEQNINVLPNQQQAALWVHETVYKYLREVNHDPDSIRARKVVGYLFSDLSRKSIGDGLKSLGLDGDVWTAQPIYQPRECPSGTHSVEINFVTLLNQPNDFILRGRIFNAEDEYFLHPITQVDAFKGWASQVCLPPGSYVYLYQVVGHPRDTQLWVMQGDVLVPNSFDSIDMDVCNFVHFSAKECASIGRRERISISN